MGFFDIEHKNKCPQCGREMDYLYGKLLCSSCGYRAAFKADIKNEQMVNSEVKQDNSYAPFENNYQQYNYAYQNQPNANYNNSNKKKTSGTVVAIIVVVITLLIIGLLSVLGVMIQKFSSTFEQIVNSEIDSKLNEMPIVTESMESYETPPASINEEGVVEYPILTTQSYGMMEFVEAIFGKSYNEVTAEEFASIIYMDFYYGDDGLPAVTYGILTEAEPEWGEYYEVSLQSFDYYDTNFSVFPNLHTLYLDDYVDVGSLSGLDELSVLGTFMTPDQIAQYVSPEQLISLTLYDMFDAPNLEGIGRFYNLTSLYINAESVENIDALVMLTSLRNLGIYYGDMIMDFQALNSLTEMESLSITSYALDDFSFVAYMPNLYSLSIGDCYYSEESAWDYIAFAFNLQWLSLENCYIPYSVEKFMALPYMEYLDIMNCMAGLDMENLTYNENLWSLDVTDTTFLKVKNGVWDSEAPELYIEDCMKQLQEYYPNLVDVYY